MREPKSHETTGTLSGLGLQGTFHEWQDGDKQRRDERLGIRTQRILRVGKTMWIQNTSGEIRELHGLLARRQITADFIATGDFAEEPQFVHFIDRTTLPDGRAVYRLKIAPPTGEPYTIAIDAKTWMIDQMSYVEHAAPETMTYYDYRTVDGMLIPFEEIDSNGDSKYDVTSHVTAVSVDTPIDPSVFAPLHPEAVAESAPVTVPYHLVNGLPFVTVGIDGHSYEFLLDSGSQGNVVDRTVAEQLQLHPQGTLEIRGVDRTASMGVVATPPMSIGAAQLPRGVATVLDLSTIVRGSHPMQGVLGYPFFAASEVRFDPDASTVTIAKPGTLPPVGEKLDVDTDRELAEVHATIDRNATTRLVVDTGNSNELLLFSSFIRDHEGVVNFAGNRPVANRGVGGSTDAVGAMVDELDLGSYRLYNRYANVILSKSGAFADRNDGGNVGFGVLRNFIATFDLANHALYLDRARGFDDGRYRSRNDSFKLPP